MCVSHHSYICVAGNGLRKAEVDGYELVVAAKLSSNDKTCREFSIAINGANFYFVEIAQKMGNDDYPFPCIGKSARAR